LDREATIDDLAAETKRVMIAAGKSYLKRKMDEPQSSSAPEIILAVSDSLLSASPPQPQPPLSPLFPPLDGPPVIRAAAAPCLHRYAIVAPSHISYHELVYV
jgi:hypothetical protein